MCGAENGKGELCVKKMLISYKSSVLIKGATLCQNNFVEYPLTESKLFPNKQSKHKPVESTLKVRQEIDRKTSYTEAQMNII